MGNPARPVAWKGQREDPSPYPIPWAGPYLAVVVFRVRVAMTLSEPSAVI